MESPPFFWLALPGILAAASGGGLAALIFVADKKRTLNRRLALFVLLEGLNTGIFNGISFLASDSISEKLLINLAVMASLAELFVYVLFIFSRDSPLAASPLLNHFRSKGLTPVVWVGAALFPVIALVQPTWFITEMHPSELYGWANYPSLATRAQYVVQISVSIFSIFVMRSAWRATPKNSKERSVLGWYAAAFIIFDLYWIPALCYYGLTNYGWEEHWYDLALILSSPVADLLFFAALALAIKKTGVFTGTRFELVGEGAIALLGVVSLFAFEGWLAERLGPQLGAGVVAAGIFAITKWFTHKAFELQQMRYGHHVVIKREILRALIASDKGFLESPNKLYDVAAALEIPPMEAEEIAAASASPTPSPDVRSSVAVVGPRAPLRRAPVRLATFELVSVRSQVRDPNIPSTMPK